MIAAVAEFFTRRRERLMSFVTTLVLPPTLTPATVLAQADEQFRNMTEDMAYTDAPQIVMAQALFFCAVYLAIYQVVRPHVDVHAYGSAVLEHLRNSTDAGFDDSEAAFSAGPGTHPGEFELEMVAPEANASGQDVFDWGYNIKSCAICYHFGRYDALDLVSYMCASDDIVSDKADQGLRRQGTIALGAGQCDFRYQKGAKPQRVAELFPSRIHFVH